MSQENVEIVMGPLPAPEVDFVSLFRDDRTAARSAEAIASGVRRICREGPRGGIAPV